MRGTVWPVVVVVVIVWSWSSLFPYSAIDMGTYETLKTTYCRSTGVDEPPVFAVLSFGALSGSIGAASVYRELVRRVPCLPSRPLKSCPIHSVPFHPVLLTSQLTRTHFSHSPRTFTSRRPDTSTPNPVRFQASSRRLPGIF
jgi:hypothetical protein